MGAEIRTGEYGFRNSVLKTNKKNLIQLNKITKFSKNFPSFKISLANTGGIRLGKGFCFDQTRPGIGLYGIDDVGKKVHLNSKPLKLPITLNAPIIQVKNVMS